MGQKRRRFSREFKEEAVELASRPDVTIKDVANDLGIHRSVPVGDAGDDQETNPAHALKPGSICRTVTLTRQRLDV
ncbi:transposase [Spiribacter salinus]|uniref:transposase n=1 Tax=Spiribacter salinus TaxID=1335746 RepID=UPI001C95CBA1